MPENPLIFLPNHRRRQTGPRWRRLLPPPWIRRALAFVLITALGALFADAASAAPAPPELAFEAPESMARHIEVLDAMDRAPLVDTMRLLGLDDPGPPIRVVITPEGSDAAQWMPSWGVAYAVGNAGLVVLVPSRVPGYPDRTLETVLHHEIAHVLIARAARRRPVPRWFNEGLAMVAAREARGEWGLDDRGRLMLATLRRGEDTLANLDQGFQGGSASASMSYALSAAFVRFLIQEEGERVIARIFEQLGNGVPFPQAIRRATGRTLGQLQGAFWDRLDLWNKWVPFLTSSTFLWLAITGLALVAFRRRRQRDAELRAQWDEEEEHRLSALPTDPWVH